MCILALSLGHWMQVHPVLPVLPLSKIQNKHYAKEEEKTNIKVAYQIAYSSTWALENRYPGKNSKNDTETWHTCLLPDCI